MGTTGVISETLHIRDSPTMGTTGLIRKVLPIRKTYKGTIHSPKEAMTSMHSKGCGSSQI